MSACRKLVRRWRVQHQADEICSSVFFIVFLITCLLIPRLWWALFPISSPVILPSRFTPLLSRLQSSGLLIVAVVEHLGKVLSPGQSAPWWPSDHVLVERNTVQSHRTSIPLATQWTKTIYGPDGTQMLLSIEPRGEKKPRNLSATKWLRNSPNKHALPLVTLDFRLILAELPRLSTVPPSSKRFNTLDGNEIPLHQTLSPLSSMVPSILCSLKPAADLHILTAPILTVPGRLHRPVCF